MAVSKDWLGVSTMEEGRAFGLQVIQGHCSQKNIVISFYSNLTLFGSIRRAHVSTIPQSQRRRYQL